VIQRRHLPSHCATRRCRWRGPISRRDVATCFFVVSLAPYNSSSACMNSMFSRQNLAMAASLDIWMGNCRYARRVSRSSARATIRTLGTRNSTSCLLYTSGKFGSTRGGRTSTMPRQAVNSGDVKVPKPPPLPIVDDKCGPASRPPQPQRC
jgi:hypothetical protein